MSFSSPSPSSPFNDYWIKVEFTGGFAATLLSDNSNKNKSKKKTTVSFLYF